MHNRKHEISRFIVRIVFLSLFTGAFFISSLPVLTRILPQMSAFAVLSSFIAEKNISFPVYFLILPGLFILAGIIGGRFFCRWVCPMGSVFSAASKFSLRKHFFKWNIAGAIFWAGIFSAVFSVPVFLFLDPLSQFTRLGLPLGQIIIPAAIVPTAFTLAIVLVHFIQPMVWCSMLCPLGYLAKFLRKDEKPVMGKFVRERREIIGGIAGGLAFSLVYRKLAVFRRGADGTKFPFLPPGAGGAAKFTATCMRCYACVKACPSGILTVKFPHNADAGSWFSPEMDANKGTCDQYCNACGTVCPTGAINFLSGEAKQKLQIGIAEVIRPACLAWTDKEHCMVCQEFCPYGAIKIDEGPDGIPRPIVKENVCRGCGACQNACPAIRQGKAILIRGVEKQCFLSK